MRSHWTHPTIIRRPTIAVLSAAALLVGCEQATAPTASRPGGGIQADATGGTVSAHGSGTVFGLSFDNHTFVFNEGGLKFSFDFSGQNLAPGAVPVFGKWSASDPVTNVQLEFTGGTATVLPSTHTLQIQFGICTITSADGTTATSFNCNLFAQDEASNGGVDTICFQSGAATGELATLPTVPPCPQLASGNMNID